MPWFLVVNQLKRAAGWSCGIASCAEGTNLDHHNDVLGTHSRLPPQAHTRSMIPGIQLAHLGRRVQSARGRAFEEPMVYCAGI